MNVNLITYSWKGKKNMLLLGLCRGISIIAKSANLVKKTTPGLHLNLHHYAHEPVRGHNFLGNSLMLKGCFCLVGITVRHACPV